MLKHTIELLEKEIEQSEVHNRSLLKDFNKWNKEYNESCFDKIKVMYGLDCNLSFNYNQTSISFLDGRNYGRVEIDSNGIEIGNLKSSDSDHEIIFNNLPKILPNVSSIQEDINTFYKEYQACTKTFNFKDVYELQSELKKLKQTYELSEVQNIINSGTEVKIDDIIYELRNTYDRVPDTKEYIYYLKEIKNKTIVVRTGAGKWDGSYIRSIQVMKENKGGKTYQVKLKGDDGREFVYDRLKKHYLTNAIQVILGTNKHSKTQLNEFNALLEEQKLKK